jgi:hypothetical protein
MHEQVGAGPTRRRLNRLVLAPLIVAGILLFGAVGVGVSVAEGKQYHVGKYRASYWTSGGGDCVMLTMSACAGSTRHVTMYGLYHPRNWAQHDGNPFIYNAYSSVDTSCPFD